MIVHPPLVFVHGAGRSGRANWPAQQTEFPDAVYLALSGYGDDEPTEPDIHAWAGQILDACNDGAHVVAHSYGAIPAVEAAAANREMVHSMTLFEPALYSIARGAEHVEDHIARMTPVVARASSLSAATYYREWLAANFGVTEPKALTTEVELKAAERLRLLPAPWDIPAPKDVYSKVPTLVISGGWNQEHEEIAGALARLGATHRVLSGFGHRVQDHPDASAQIQKWITQL